MNLIGYYQSLIKKGYKLEDIDYTLLLEKKEETSSGMGLNTGIQF